LVGHGLQLALDEFFRFALLRKLGNSLSLFVSVAQAEVLASCICRTDVAMTAGYGGIVVVVDDILGCSGKGQN
jgi:hypothetical protein